MRQRSRRRLVVREGDHREREDDRGKPLRKIAWALEATIATTARPPHAQPGCPSLAIGLALARPGEDPGGTGARVLASAAARGHKTGWLGYDRAYTQALPGRFDSRPAPWTPPRHGRPRRRARHPGPYRRRHPGGRYRAPPRPAESLITAMTRLRGRAITCGLYDEQSPPAPATSSNTRRSRRRRLPAAVLPRLWHPPRLICPLRPASPSRCDEPAEVLQLLGTCSGSAAQDCDHHRLVHRALCQDLSYGSPASTTTAPSRRSSKASTVMRKTPPDQALRRPPSPPRPSASRPVPVHRVVVVGPPDCTRTPPAGHHSQRIRPQSLCCPRRARTSPRNHLLDG